MSPSYCLWDLAASCHPQLQSFRMIILKACNEVFRQALFCKSAGLGKPQSSPSLLHFHFPVPGLRFLFPHRPTENCPYPIRLLALVVIPFSHLVILPAQALFGGGGGEQHWFGLVFEALVLCVCLYRCMHDINVCRDHRTILGNWFSPSTCGSGNQCDIEVIRFGGKSSSPRNHLRSPAVQVSDISLHPHPHPQRL